MLLISSQSSNASLAVSSRVKEEGVGGWVVELPPPPSCCCSRFRLVEEEEGGGGGGCVGGKEGGTGCQPVAS